MASSAINTNGDSQKQPPQLRFFEEPRNHAVPRHIFVFDNMRNRSHLFWRWISTHPALYTTYHPYLYPGFLGPEGCLSKLRDTEARIEEIGQMLQFCGSDETYDSSSRKLEQHIENADKEGKILFTNEHVIDLINHYIQVEILRKGDVAFPSFDLPFPNPTYLPDKLLNNFKPVILIRHPVEQVRSIYTSMSAHTKCRPGGENFDLITSLSYARLMFEYFRLARGETPVVVDGEDVLWRTEELGRKFCSAFGLDPAGLKDQWAPLPQSWWASNPFVYAMTKTLVESMGIERPSKQPTAPDPERAFKEWKEQYGEQVAMQLRERVDAAMPHYEYLVKFKL